MKKIVIVLISIIVVLVTIISLYFYGLTGFKSQDLVIFNVRNGASIKEVINNLYKSKLIKSKIAGTIYIYTHKDLTVYPGSYELSRDMGLVNILKNLRTTKEYRLTLVEGKRFIDYIDKICELGDFDKDEVLAKLSDKEYLNNLISKYSFLDESILNDKIYYPLEGYLFPDTYYIAKGSSIETIIEKILAKTEEVLDNYSAMFKESKYNYHEILTIASIIENETIYNEDKKVVSEVIYKRLNINMSLGMDVTTYYGVKKNLGETLTQEDINNDNPYNTRLLSFLGLPVGPICNPGREAIMAALNPSDDDYIYFYADQNGKLHFAKTYEEHQKNQEKYGW